MDFEAKIFLESRKSCEIVLAENCVLYFVILAFVVFVSSEVMRVLMLGAYSHARETSTLRTIGMSFFLAAR